MSNFQVHTANPGNKLCKERSQYTREKAWENLKDDVKHLYVTEGLGLKEVQVRLRSQGKYNFEATKRQWDYRLRQWGIYKNGKNATGGKRHRRFVTAPATQPELGRHTASLHDLATLSTATVSDDRSDSYVTTPVIEVEVNAITASDNSGHDIDATGTAVETNIITVPEDSDYDIDMSGTAVEANATQINSIPKFSCGSMDLSWAFDTPLQELLKGHPNDQHRLPLRALAEGLVELANDKGIAVSDPTLFQVLRGLEHCIESHQNSMVNGGWEFRITKMVIGGSDVLIRVAMKHVIMTKRRYSAYYCEEQHHLALRLRMESGHTSFLDRGLTFAVCSGCGTEEMLDASFRGGTGHLNMLRRHLVSNKTAASCFMLWYQSGNFFDKHQEVTVEIPGLLLSRRLPKYHPSLTSGSLSIKTWSFFFLRRFFLDKSIFLDHEFTRCIDLTSVALEHGAPIDECIDDQGRNLLHHLGQAEAMQVDHRLRCLQYFQRLGVDMEHRDDEGKTPFLAAIACYCYSLDSVSTFLEADANLGAVDNMGRGYLRIALERYGFLFGNSEFSLFFDQANLLVKLLSADPRFEERAITPSETPRLIELAFSAVAWDAWTSVFEKLDWDMKKMNMYRYSVLDKPLPSYLEHYEEARLQMLAQTRFRLGDYR